MDDSEHTVKERKGGGYECDGCGEVTSTQSPATIRNEDGYHYVTWYCVACDQENRIKFPMENVA